MWSCGAYDASFAVQRKQLIPLSIRVPLPLEPMHCWLLPSARAKSAAKCDSHERLFAASIPSERILCKRTIARRFHGRGKNFYKAPVGFEPRRSSANNREKVPLTARTMAKVEPRRAGWRQRSRRTATAHAQSYAPIVGRTGF